MVSGEMLHSRIPCIPTDLEPKLAKVLLLCKKGENSHDHHAVAISEEDTYYTLNHLLWEISKERFFLLKMGGAIKSKTVEPYIHLMST